MGNYIVSIDPEGVLGFSDHLLAKKGRPAAHVIEVLTEKASCEYRTYLKDRGISYLSGGGEQVDFSRVLEKLAAQFGIERLMAAGGGILNWSLLQEGLIDELSLVIAPVADGNTDSVSIFEQSEFMSSGKPAAFCLKGAKEMEGNVLWLRYEAVRT
ncbi:MAG: dihydrofolate reductase family protein [Clostridia bacterium]